VKRALLLLLLCAACKQQDAAMLVTISGAYRVPADADKLSIDVLDGTTLIKHHEWCASTNTSCTDSDALPVQTSLNETVTLVQSGADHPHVKINVELRKGVPVVGLGSVQADFSSGTTVEVQVPVTSP
jgi:hypothetical protein